MTMPAPLELIDAWRSKQVSGTALMRGLVSFPEWRLLLSESAVAETLASNAPPRFQYNVTPDGKKRLPIFSSDESLKAYLVDSQAEQYHLKTKGTWVFKLPFEELDEIWIDPAQQEAIFYGKEHFERFRDLAAAIEIEEDITQLREGNSSDGACVRVRSYPAYRVVVNMIGNHLVMAPDQQGRTLAAVFTSEDACDAFLEEASKQNATQLEPLIYSGQNLFEILSKMDLTGMVFNCSGPTSPVAFAAAFSQVILES
jgi:hypothetical protein